MIIDYPVQLLPLKSLNTDESVKLASPGEEFYAVLSHNKIIAKSDSVPKLGIEYRKYVLSHVQDKTIRVISYEPPFSEAHIKEGIFNVKTLGGRLREFNNGELLSLVKLEKMVSEEKKE
jgi:hypothetical protein